MGQELLEFRPRITRSEQVKEVEVRAWDPSRKQVLVATAPAATTSAQLTSDPVGLAGTFADARLVSNRDPVATQSAVDAAAQALAERMGSSFAEANGVVRGTPTLRAGTPFSVSVVGGDFQGRYLATTTRHVFDRDGYRTEFSVTGRQDRSLLGLMGSNGHGSSQGGSVGPGLMVAIVTDIDDPERMGRVKLKFPSLSDTYESDWVRVVSPGPPRRPAWCSCPTSTTRCSWASSTATSAGHTSWVPSGTASTSRPWATARSTTGTTSARGSCRDATTGSCSSTPMARRASRS